MDRFVDKLHYFKKTRSLVNQKPILSFEVYETYILGHFTCRLLQEALNATNISNKLRATNKTLLGQDLTIVGSTTALGAVEISGSTIINNTLDVKQSTTLEGTLDVNDRVLLNDALDVVGSSILNSLVASDVTADSLDIIGDAIIEGILDVTQSATLNKTLDVKQSTTLEGTLDVYKNVSLGAGLNVSGPANFYNKVYTAPLDALPLKSQISTGSYIANSIAISPNGSFIAITDTEAGNSLKIYGVDASGNLTLTPTSSTNAGLSTFVAWAPTWSDSTGGFVATLANGTLNTFGVDKDGIVSASISTQALNAATMAWAPTWSESTGGFIAITENSGKTVKTFGIDASGNISAALSSQALSVPSYCVAWSPNWSNTTGGLLALTKYGNTANVAQTFSMDTSGNLSSVISTQHTGLSPVNISWTTNGEMIIVKSGNAPLSLKSFSIDEGGNISPAISTQFTLGGTAGFMALSPIWDDEYGSIIAVAGADSSTIQLFRLEPSGRISSMIGYANSESYSIFLAWAPNGSFIVVANYLSNSIQTFSIDI